MSTSGVEGSIFICFLNFPVQLLGVSSSWSLTISTTLSFMSWFWDTSGKYDVIRWKNQPSLCKSGILVLLENWTTLEAELAHVRTDLSSLLESELAKMLSPICNVCNMMKFLQISPVERVCWSPHHLRKRIVRLVLGHCSLPHACTLTPSYSRFWVGRVIKAPVCFMQKGLESIWRGEGHWFIFAHPHL